jgi:hypothetical protein
MPNQRKIPAKTSGAQVGDHLDGGIRARRQLRQHVDHEVRPLAHRDHRAQHDHPDEEEAGQLLRPDPGGNERGVARDDLQRDRDDQDPDHGRHQPREQPMVAIEEPLHFTALIFW